MIKKATAKAPANIAFIKYWGQRDRELVLPVSDTISMNLSDCFTTTTVDFGDYKNDQVEIKYDGGKLEVVSGKAADRVLAQVQRFRELMGIRENVRIVSQNTFPAGAGIASSASAFAALTKALAQATGWNGTKQELSVLTRLAGSGSACRSIDDGFVKWNHGKDSASSYAETLYPVGYWDLVDIVVVVDDGHKAIGSAEGHLYAHTSPLFKSRVRDLPVRIGQVEAGLHHKDIEQLGEAIEIEAISFHAVAMTSSPRLFYWNGMTIILMNLLQECRKEGIVGYFTIDAGPNIHIICEGSMVAQLQQRLNKVDGVKRLYVNKPCEGARVVEEQLF